MHPRSIMLIMAVLLAVGSPDAVRAQAVSLRPTSDGLIADYRMTETEDGIAFADPDLVRSDWTRLGARSFLVRPDSTEDGRGYIALARVGEGYVLYAPALTAAGETLTMSLDGPEGWTLAPADDARGYVYVGPASAVRRLPSGALTIAAPDLSPGLETTVFGAFDAATGFYTDRFGPPPTVPILSVTAQGAGPGPFRGDVTDSGMISTRFNGKAWAEPDADALKGVAAFIFHETAHLWNSHYARPAEGSPWLHEGGAEYMALVGAVSTGLLTEGEARESLSGRLTECRRRVGSRTPAADRMRSGSAVYDCGTLIQWLADMELRASGPGRSIFDVWSDLIGAAGAGRPDYSPADFRARLAPDSAVTLLFDGPGEERWSAIDARLTALGVRWENRPSNQDYVIGTLSHLNAQTCAAGASTGFYIRDGYVQTANDDRCGRLSGEIPLTTVAGVDPLAEPRAMFDAVQALCAAKAPVAVVRRDTGESLSIDCSAPLATPTVYAITAAPALRL
jgi:hypothetical protein